MYLMLIAEKTFDFFLQFFITDRGRFNFARGQKKASIFAIHWSLLIDYSEIPALFRRIFWKAILKRGCPSVCQSIGPSVCWFIGPSVISFFCGQKQRWRATYAVYHCFLIKCLRNFNICITPVK